jgi:hypothetical protein
MVFFEHARKSDSRHPQRSSKPRKHTIDYMKRIGSGVTVKVPCSMFRMIPRMDHKYDVLPLMSFLSSASLSFQYPILGQKYTIPLERFLV